MVSCLGQKSKATIILKYKLFLDNMSLCIYYLIVQKIIYIIFQLQSVVNDHKISITVTNKHKNKHLLQISLILFEL